MSFNFFKINPNYTPEELALRSSILSDLYLFRGSLAGVENDYGKDGKYATRYITYQTTLTLVTTFCIGGLITLFFSNSTGLYIAICFFLIVIWGFAPRWLRNKKNSDEALLKEWIETNLREKKGGKARFKIWRFFVCISPFSLRTIWIWSLIFGLYISLKSAQIGLCFGCGFNFEKFNEFSIDFLKTLIVVILSYIATNIISELLNLREEYVKSSDSVKQVTLDISDATKELREDLTNSDALIKDVIANIKNQKFFAPLQAEYDAFQQLKAQKYNSPSDRLNKSFEKYSELLSKQIGILSTRLTGNSIIDLWILTGLKSAAELRVTQIEEQNSITTLFEVFGGIIAACLENFEESEDKNQTEIYTVFALPPNRYLNYNGNEPLSKYWKQYLEKNVEAAKEGVQIHRHFLSFTNAADDIKALAGEEGADLGDLEVRKKWKEKYWTKADGNPYFNESLQRFQREDEIVEDKTLIAKPLNEILASTYHCPNCCKLIKVDLTKTWKDTLYSEKYKKPVDYFALKSKNEWIFCFKTYYDKGFNAAIVEFWHDLHPLHDEWLNIKANLNRLFTNDKANGIEIDNITSII